MALSLARADASTAPNHIETIARQSAAGAECLSMTVTTSQALRDRNKRHFRIVFENRCESMRILYWCAEQRAQVGDAPQLCAGDETSRSAIASPLYAIEQRREFQWSFPVGTRIRFVACSDGTYPTTDLRCAVPPAKGGS